MAEKKSVEPADDTAVDSAASPLHSAGMSRYRVASLLLVLLSSCSTFAQVSFDYDKMKLLDSARQELNEEATHDRIAWL